MKTLKERVDAVLEGYVMEIGADFDSYEMLGDFAAELLEAIADDTLEREPFATLWVGSCRDAAGTLRRSLAELGTDADAEAADVGEPCGKPAPNGPCTEPRDHADECRHEGGA